MKLTFDFRKECMNFILKSFKQCSNCCYGQFIATFNMINKNLTYKWVLKTSHSNINQILN